MVEVLVLIPTFRRPSWLARLLRALEELETSAAVSVLVADNDADLHQGADVCDSLRLAGYRWPLRAIIVAERGISQARNALFAEALKCSGEDAFVAMLDDDEWPTKDWLAHYLAVQQATGAEIVQGPVICEFPYAPPALVELANTSVPPRCDSGVVPIIDAGGNVLMRRSSLLRLHGRWFDPKFGLTGGEDKDFFFRMGQKGATFAWASGAIAYTSIPDSRMSLRWALQRGFRAGNTDMRMTLKYERSAGRLFFEGTKMLGGILLSPFGLVAISARRRARAVYTLARSLGKAAASFGAVYREYETTHGA